MTWDKNLPTFFFFFSNFNISPSRLYPAVASISIYHLLKVTVVAIINPVNRWPRKQDSIYRALFKSSGKLVLPKSEWGNYLNHLRPSISDSCVWWVHRPWTLGPSLLVSSLWLYLVRVSCTPDNLGGHKTVWPMQSLFYTQEVFGIDPSAATCARVKLKKMEGSSVFCCTHLSVQIPRWQATNVCSGMRPNPSRG